MASDSPAANPPQYACICLNIRIISSHSPTCSPESTCDPAYAPVFVSDDGIAIVCIFFIYNSSTSSLIISQKHPQVTVRTTTQVESIPGTSRYSRFTILTCLLCRLPVYRVFQTISLEVQGKESILFPTEDWVEHDILKSATGWIQVHKDSIVSIHLILQEFNSMNSSDCSFFWLQPRGEVVPFVHFV